MGCTVTVWIIIQRRGRLHAHGVYPAVDAEGEEGLCEELWLGEGVLEEAVGRTDAGCALVAAEEADADVLGGVELGGVSRGGAGQ